MSRYILKPSVGTPLNKHHPWSKSSTGLWLFNEGRGELVADLAKNYKATFQNNPTWARSGVEFDADTEHIKGPNGGEILNSEGTICFSFTATNTPATWRYFCVLDDDYSEFSILHEPGTAWLEVDINSTAVWLNAGVDVIDSAINLDIVITWSSVANIAISYQNGIFVAQDSSQTITWDAAGVAAHDLRIGGRATGLGRHAGGIIHYFYVFNRVLSPSEILSLHLDSYQMFRPDPIELWSYEEATPTTFRFYSNGNVEIEGEYDETKNHFRMINNGNIECSELDEITLTGNKQRIYSDHRLHISGEFTEL